MVCKSNERERLSFVSCLTGPYLCARISGLNPVLAGEVSCMSDVTKSFSCL